MQVYNTNKLYAVSYALYQTVHVRCMYMYMVHCMCIQYIRIKEATICICPRMKLE